MDHVNPWVLAIDLGGTWTRFAAIDAGGRLVVRRRRATGSDLEPERIRAGWRAELEAVAVDAGRAGLAAAPRAVGVGATGPVERGSGRLLDPPNTGPGLAGLALVAEFGALVDAPVAVERDTNAALIAEHTRGAARGADHVVYLTLSTGVGGAVLEGGRLLHGRHGGAGELGHLVSDPAGPRCGCGRRGCLEAIASGPALAAEASRRIAAGATSALASAPEPLTGAAVGVAAQRGDALARAVLDAARDAVARAVVDIANAFDPELVVVGGSVGLGQPGWIDTAERAVRARALPPTRDGCRVVPADLGDDAVLYGAAALAWDLRA
ncbi:MAG: ROK family protein [Actinomycetales bacterium]|nr:ROK family protein [Actinomycetales bacterium]